MQVGGSQVQIVVGAVVVSMAGVVEVVFMVVVVLTWMTAVASMAVVAAVMVVALGTAGLDPATAARSQAVAAYSRTARSRRALPITDTELSAMAAAAITGDSRMPATGYRTPAATGTPMAL